MTKLPEVTWKCLVCGHEGTSGTCPNCPDPTLTPRQEAINRGDIVIRVEIESKAGMAYADHIVSGSGCAMLQGRQSTYLEFEASGAMVAAVREFCQRTGLEA